MLEIDFRDDRNSRVRLAGSCATGVLLGAGLAQVDVFGSPGNVAVELLGVSSGNALQVLQSVGILLPLVVGLLRFTTNDQSKVNGRTNDHLLLGILGLVLAGASAVIAGLFTEMTQLLKLALLFVLLTFVFVGLAAGAMFGELSPETDGTEDLERTDDGTDDSTNCSSPTDDEDVASHEAEAESESESKAGGEQATEASDG